MLSNSDVLRRELIQAAVPFVFPQIKLAACSALAMTLKSELRDQLGDLR